jgi:type IX secretion system PorP/SprF family membrane protein
MELYHRHIVKIAVLLVCITANGQYANAQIYLMGATYFQNQYLVNPAMAGSQKGLNLNLGYRKQSNNLPGSPMVQTLTGDFGFNDKVGVGLNIYSDKAGLFKRMRTVASYSYRLRLNGEDEHLSFGLSLGFMHERVSEEDIHGDVGDVSVNNYNKQDTYIDGDFGLAYRNKGLSLQVSLPNMKGFFKKDANTNTVDRSVFFSAVGYNIKLSEVFDAEPKICYRGVKSYDNILDAGINLNYANRISLFGMYHSLQSTTYGLGINYQFISINGIYTTATSALGGYTDGNFEMNVTLNLSK